MRRHLETLKQKPEHVRHRMALGTAAGITGLVGIIWITTLAASGSFALSAPNAGTGDSDIAEARSSFNELVGAVGAVGQGSGSVGRNDPELTIIDGQTTSTIAPSRQNPTDATVIPF